MTTDPADPLSVLYKLHTQLRILVPVLTAAPEQPEITTMLGGLEATTGRAANLLTVAEPSALAAIHRALEHATSGRHNETVSELLAAYRRLSVLLRRDRPRRPAAADELTRRWQLEP